MTDTSKENPTSAAPGLVIERTFDAPRKMVWRAWTEIDQLERWICPRDFKVVFCEGDLRPGGKWRTGMRSPEGEKHICGGEYREVISPSKLVFTHAWEDEKGSLGPPTQVTVAFSDENGKTLMRFEQTGFGSIESRNGHEDGWSGAFENLSAHLGRGEGENKLLAELSGTSGRSSAP